MRAARDYQRELRALIVDAIRRGKKSIIVRLPTGGGKTFIGGDLMHGCEKKSNHSVFLAPRRELVYQTVESLQDFGISPGMIMAGEAMHTHRLCQVASFDTLHARAIRSNRIALPRAKVVVVDEAHLSLADTRREIIEAFGEEAIIVGLTATPARGDGRPLGSMYDEMVVGAGERELMDKGWLVDAVYYAPTEPDLRAVKTRQGDWEIKGLEAEMNKPAIVGSVVDNWRKLARGQSTVVFCVTRAHGRHVTSAFLAAGIRAEFVDGETREDDRKAIFARVASRETTVLVNVFVASYGLDIPPLAVCQLARPTKSLVLYRQMGGRVLRPLYADGFDLETDEGRLAAIANSEKPHAMVIDHSGAVLRHGTLDEDIPWTLEGDESVSDVREKQRAEKTEPKQITCPKCAAIFKGTRFCPRCGFELIPPGEPIPVHKADLQEVVKEGKAANRKMSWDEKAEFYAQARGYARTKGYKDGYAAALYRDKFGVWPNDGRVRDTAPKAPGELIKGFIKHKAIKAKMGRKSA